MCSLSGGVKEEKGTELLEKVEEIKKEIEEKNA
jgi:hypothetical protein